MPKIENYWAGSPPMPPVKFAPAPYPSRIFAPETMIETSSVRLAF